MQAKEIFAFDCVEIFLIIISASLLSLRMWIIFNGFMISFAYLLVVSYGGMDLRTLKGKDRYAEELVIKRLESGHLLVQFRFVITSDAKSGVFLLCFNTNYLMNKLIIVE